MNYTIRKLVLFIQGPNQPESVWSKLIGVFQTQADFGLEWACEAYHPNEDSVTLGEATEHFGDWYTQQKATHLNTDIVLVGHGIGGIVILNYIAQKLQNGLSRDFFNLRQIILYAVPHLGYQAVSSSARLMSKLGRNTFIDVLKKWDSDIHLMNEQITECVIDPSEINSYYRPVSVQAFGGTDDRFVSPESAQGNWADFELLTGSHTSVIEPDNASDERFIQFQNCLLNPPPHKGIYYLDKLETNIKVEPFPDNLYEARYGQHMRSIQTDNYGTIFRRVKFASNNGCFQPYSLRYSIENEQGFIQATTAGGANITAPKNHQAYEARGLEYYFEFIPELDREFSLLIELYKGFDEGYRDVHFHLGNGSTRFKTLQIEIDLSRYLEKGYIIIPEPTLMLHPEDTHSCNDRFTERSAERVVPLKSSGVGCWEWEINDIGGGVIDLFWDIKPN